MSFISYAQNFEDVMLWRALKHVQHGVYVDVGAQHPVIDSVSKAFYERGWRGIHIEPTPEYAELLRKDRPDETVLQVALADTEGTLELNVIPGTGLSTAVDAYAQRHQVERDFERQRIEVLVLTLKSALTSLVGKEVHWLKIDVEGFEEKVLKGWDSQILRPWVMVVEATIPNSPETDYASWDPILTAADYQFVYFDGLNRFYIAKEHAELAEAFSRPPNVFDDVELSGLASWGLCRGLIAFQQASEKELSTQAKKFAIDLDSERQRTVQLGTELQAVQEHESRLQIHTQWLQNEWDAAQQHVEEFSQRTGRLEGELTQTRERIGALDRALSDTRSEGEALRQQLVAAQQQAAHVAAELAASQAKVDELNQSSHHWWMMADGLNRELKAVYASRSWRITQPLRKTMMAAKWLVVWVMRQTLANPRLKVRALGVLAKHPKLYQRLRQFAIRSGLIAGGNMTSLTSHQFNPGSGSENTVATTSPPNTPEELIKNLSPRTARIYIDLKKAIGTRKS